MGRARRGWIWIAAAAGIYWLPAPLAAEWSSIGALSGQTVRALAWTPFGLYAGTDGGGVFRADSGGEPPWIQVNEGLTNTHVTALALIVVPPPFPLGCPPPCGYSYYLYAGTSGGGVFSFDGAKWTANNSGLGELAVTALAACFNPPGLYVGTEAGKVYRLLPFAAGPQAWTPTGGGLQGAPVSALAFASDFPAVILAGTSHGIYRSTDDGASWSEVHRVQGGSITMLAGNSADNTIWAGTLAGAQGMSPISRGSLLRSSDNGASWQVLTSSIATPLSLQGVGTTSYVGTTDGVIRSDDGSVWSAAGLGGLAVPALFNEYPENLYAGTVGLGLYHNDLLLAACQPSSRRLCLNRGEFSVEVFWIASNIGQSGVGQAMPLTSDSGAFWFFQPSNIELVIKVLDGRAINGHFWVFYGALSNVGYTITVTDTATGAVKTYTNPEGQLASVADTEAF